MLFRILLSQGKTTCVDSQDFEWLNQWKWSIDGRGYVVGRPIKELSGKQRLIKMHRFIINAPKNSLVDHIDGNKLNNRRSNLRLCTRSENGVNRGLPKHNTTGFKGVYYYKKIKKYVAAIRYMKKLIYLGCFKNKKDAAVAYNLKAKELFGNFAKLNKPC